MSIIARLRNEHAALSRCVTDLSRLAAAAAPPAGLAAKRWELARLLAAHLAVEDRHVYGSHRDDARSSVRMVVRRFEGEMGALAGDFRAHMDMWTAERIGGDWHGYAAALRVLLTTLSRRIAREERELYPLLDTGEGADARRRS